MPCVLAFSMQRSDAKRNEITDCVSSVDQSRWEWTISIAACVAKLCRSFEYAERPCEAAVVKAAQLRVHDVLSDFIGFVFRVAADVNVRSDKCRASSIVSSSAVVLVVADNTGIESLLAPSTRSETPLMYDARGEAR